MIHTILYKTTCSTINKFASMKNINSFLFCCTTAFLLLACGNGSKSKSDSSENNDNSAETICITAEENTVILLTHPTSCKIENTENGCLVTFKTEAGKQVFLLPCQYNLAAFDNQRANGSYQEIEFIPGNVFKRDTGFSMKGNVTVYDGKGITFLLPNYKLLSIVGIFLYDKKALDMSTVRIQHLKMKTISKEELHVLGINVALASSPDHIISHVYVPSSDPLSKAIDVKQAVTDKKIEDCKIVNF